MSNPAELDLVRKALTDGLDGCVEWDVTVFERVEAELALHGLALRRIRNALIQFIRSGGDVVQVKETRDGWKDRREYWYKVIVPMPDLFPKGLFVELELRQLRRPDPEFPEVTLVNAHEQH